MSFPFDATLKEIVSQAPGDFCAPFRLPLTEPVVSLNIDLATISAATDVSLGFGDPMQEIVDLNFQSGYDSAVAARLHLYNAALHLRYGVPVRTVLVLLRPKADYRELNGKLIYVSGKNRITFQYDVVRLWRESAHAFLHGGIGLLPLATLCKMPAGMALVDALRDVVAEIDWRLAALPDHARAVRLMSAASTLMTGRIAKEAVANIFSGVKIMHQTTLWDEIEEIQIRTNQQTLLRQGRIKFGNPTRKVEKELKSIQEVPRLERLVDAMMQVNSWKELLAIR